MKKATFTCFLLTICVFIASEESAYAYLDPGTGSAILQGILAAFAGIAVALKLYWHRFLRLLGLKKSKNPNEQSKNENSKNQSSHTNE